MVTSKSQGIATEDFWLSQKCMHALTERSGIKSRGTAKSCSGGSKIKLSPGRVHARRSAFGVYVRTFPHTHNAQATAVCV